LSTIVSMLLNRFMNYLSFRIIKFVATVLTSIFWYLSVSNKNLITFAFWANFNKISRYLKIFIMRLFKKSIFRSSQNLISDFDMVAILLKKPVWEVISN
jgi:hypothetical protein